MHAVISTRVKRVVTVMVKRVGIEIGMWLCLFWSVELGLLGPAGGSFSL